MAHFAELDENNVVKQVIVINNDVIQNLPFPESEPIGAEFCQNLLGGNWVQTSYNGNFRKNYAGIGSVYIASSDVFTLPKPYPSWTLDADFNWQAPVPRPTDGKIYRWDESTLSWVEVQMP